MQIFLPSLEAKIIALGESLRIIVFVILVVGLIAHAGSARDGQSGIFALIAKAMVIVAAIAYLATWFPKVEQVFIATADYINPTYSAAPTSASDAIRESTTQNPEGKGWSWRNLNESIYQAFTRAIANVFIYIGTLISVPMLILQYILKWLMYLVAPFMLALFLVPGFSGIPIRFFQQLLAILAWPVGFAITNLVALAIWRDFRNAVGANPTSGAEVVYSPLLTFTGGILGTIMIIVGTLATPVVMQALFSQGHAFSGNSGKITHLMSFGRSAVVAARASVAASPVGSASGSRPLPLPQAPNSGRPGL